MNNFFFKLFYIFFIILVIACNNDKSLKQSEKESHTNNCIDIEKYYNEFLTSDSITINNSISFIAAKSDVEKIFGKPIKIENLNKPTNLTLFIDEKQSNLKRIYFESAIFESNQDKLVLSSISFRQNGSNIIKHPLIILSNKTVGLDLFKPFPEHLKTKMFYKRGCNICSYAINIKAYKNNDDFWTLVFIRDTLSRLDFHPISFKDQVQ